MSRHFDRRHTLTSTSSIALTVLCSVLLLSGYASGSSITMTGTLITASGGGVYDPSVAVAGQKFVYQVNVTAMQNGIASISYSVKWDPSELALTAFTDGRCDTYDPLLAVSVGGPLAQVGINYGELTAPAGGTSSVVGAGISNFEQFTEVIMPSGNPEVDGFFMLNAAGFATKGANLGAIAQLSFEVLTPANGPGDIDLQAFFRPGADGIIDTGGVDLTSMADLTGTQVAISPVPEPASLMLLTCGVLAMGLVRNRRQKGEL